jgi:hypothetical protein
VTVRGGEYRYYRFEEVPVVAVTMKMTMSLADFFSDSFIANMALLLSIDSSRIKIASVRQGSVIADFTVGPDDSAVTSLSGYVQQLNELTTNLSIAISTGQAAEILAVPIEQVLSVLPVVPQAFDNAAASNNNSYNATAARLKQINDLAGTLKILLTYPTGQPTAVPSLQPSSYPSHPTSTPSRQPTTQPFRQPSNQPTSRPSSQPTSQPIKHPSRQPSRYAICFMSVICDLMIGTLVAHLASPRTNLQRSRLGSLCGMQFAL